MLGGPFLPARGLSENTQPAPLSTEAALLCLFSRQVLVFELTFPHEIKLEKT